MTIIINCIFLLITYGTIGIVSILSSNSKYKEPYIGNILKFSSDSITIFKTLILSIG